MYRVFQDSGIARLAGYSTRLPLTFRVDERALAFMFDSGVYTTRPEALFQHAILTRPMTVNSAAFMFSSICKADLKSYQLEKTRCFALTRAPQQVLDLPGVQNELAKLDAYGTVIDLAQYDHAVDRLKCLASELLTTVG